MCRFHSLLWVLCATPVCSIFQGTCLQKEPPPGVLVVSPGSRLVLTCDGDVRVDGAKVKVAKHTSSDKETSREIHNSDGDLTKTDTNASKDKSQEEGLQRTGHTSSFVTHQVVQPSSTPLKDENTDDNKGTRGGKGKSKWKWNGKTVRRGHRHWEGFTSGKSGMQLSVNSVGLKNSGNYTCLYRSQVIFSLKVIVAEPPEVPSLSCTKKSPSSKIRCDWTPQKPLTLRPNCYLLINKWPSDSFHRARCSFSSQWSRCWCVLEYNEDELRTLHTAYLCVTNMAGNATSGVLSFNPLDILKPDPPSAVSVRQEVGYENRMTVNWTFPASWKSHDSYYELVYQLKYQPVDSSSSSLQLKSIKGRRSFTITDVISDVKYMIQIRTKDEFDGLWSEWTAPVYASSWIDLRTHEPIDLLSDDLLNVTVYSPDTLMKAEKPAETCQFPEDEGSGTEEPSEAVSEVSVSPITMSHHIIWISCLFAILAIIMAAYMLRHKEKFLAKVHSLSFRSKYKGLAQPKPAVPVAPEGQALVTFDPPRPEEELPVSEEEEDPGGIDAETERREATHFNNTSYFFMQSE